MRTSELTQPTATQHPVRATSSTFAALLAASVMFAAGCATQEEADETLADDQVAALSADGQLGADLTGDVGQWVWHDVPGAQCGHGQQTGYGIRKGTSSELVIYLEGGGLCWDEISCRFEIPPNPITAGQTMLASYFKDGFGGANFTAIRDGGGYQAGIFNNKQANNPYKDATIVYVPYCTGDLHTGSTDPYFFFEQKTAHFRGGTNLGLYLDQIVPAFSAVTRVTLAGMSAGGYGALLNYDRVAKRFDGKRVDLVDDSGPILWQNPIVGGGFAAWNTGAIMPKGCTNCSLGYAHLYSYLAKTYPASRFALLIHDMDPVISVGNLALPFPMFYFLIRDFVNSTIAPNANWRYFIAGGLSHGFSYNISEQSVRQQMLCKYVFGICFPYWVPVGTELADWLTLMNKDSSSWANTSSIPF